MEAMALDEAASLSKPLLASINGQTGQDFDYQDKYAPNGKIGWLYTSSDRKGLMFHMDGPEIARIDYWKHIRLDPKGYPVKADRSIYAVDASDGDIIHAVQRAVSGGVSEADGDSGSHSLPPVKDGEPASYGNTQEETKNKGIEMENSKREVTPEFLKKLLKDKLQGMKDGDFDGLLIYGDKGVGKTFPVKKFLKDNGIKYRKFSGTITKAGLFMALWENRHPSIWMLFDDIDSVFQDADCRNMIKAALDTARDEREITYKTKNVSFDASGMTDAQMEQAVKASGGKKFPDTFLYQGKIIFISNLRTDQIEPAILSRTQKVNYELTTAQIWDLTASMMMEFEIARNPPQKIRAYVLELMKKNWKLREKPDFRVYMAACATFMRVYQDTHSLDEASNMVLYEIGGLS